MRILCLLFSVFVLFLFSCTSQRAVTNNYLEKLNDTSGKDSIPLDQQVIQKNDLLAIRVYSTAIGTSPETDAPYNLVDLGTGAAGFLVDRNGNIEYPQIGIIHAEGMTKEELAEFIRKRFESQLQNPSVVVRLVNYRITVLGEVGGPSTFTVPTEKITILEALGLAGDITEFGRKDNVKVIREINGHREVGTIDLTSKEMFSSPYYRLQQNDVVLVEQTRRKVKQQEQQMLVQQIGIASSIITAIALVLNLIK
jgi:polysaccharide export outer membrane protein